MIMMIIIIKNAFPYNVLTCHGSKEFLYIISFNSASGEDKLADAIGTPTISLTPTLMSPIGTVDIPRPTDSFPTQASIFLSFPDGFFSCVIACSAHM